MPGNKRKPTDNIAQKGDIMNNYNGKFSSRNNNGQRQRMNQSQRNSSAAQPSQAHPSEQSCPANSNSSQSNTRHAKNYYKQNNNTNRSDPRFKQSPSTPQNTQTAEQKPENPQIDNLLNTASRTLKTSPDELKQAAQNGNVQKLLSQMTPSQAQRVQNILADENAAKKLLNSPQAQALLRSLSKNE